MRKRAPSGMFLWTPGVQVPYFPRRRRSRAALEVPALSEKIVLAFSGGLDTSFCAIYLRETTGAEIVSVCVDTGGFQPGELDHVSTRAQAAGVRDHRTVDGTQAVYERFVSYLIKGNCLRGGVYPMCVGAERVVQAEEVVRVAVDVGATGIAHGSTGAGNDQVRFDVAIRTLAPHLKIHAPVRDLNWSRDQETEYLGARGLHVPPKTTAYSVNVGLFGTTIGGKETHDTWAVPPEEVYTMTIAAEQARDQAEELVLGFEAGLPVSLDGARLDGVSLIRALNARCKPRTASAAGSTSATRSSGSRAASPSRPRARWCWSRPTASSRSSCRPSGRPSGATASASSTAACSTKASTTTP